MWAFHVGENTTILRLVFTNMGKGIPKSIQIRTGDDNKYRYFPTSVIS